MKKKKSYGDSEALPEAPSKNDHEGEEQVLAYDPDKGNILQWRKKRKPRKK